MLAIPGYLEGAFQISPVPLEIILIERCHFARGTVLKLAVVSMV